MSAADLSMQTPATGPGQTMFARLKIRAKRRAQGFTLIELMFVVSIIGILATLGIGFSGSLLKDQRMKATARALQTAISMARAKAVQTGSPATFSVASNVVYAYNDLNRNNVYDSGDVLIYRYPTAAQTPLPDTTTIYVAPTGTTGGAMQTGFTFEGLYYDNTGALATVTLCVKDTTLPDVRAVQMSVTGACRSFGQAAAAALCP